MASSATVVPNYLETLRGRKVSEYQAMLPMAASTVLMPGSGRYVYVDSNGNYALAGASQTQLNGWVYDCHSPDHTGATGTSSAAGITCSATDGATVLNGTTNIHTEDDAVWMYSVETLVAANLGLKCDLVVTGSAATTIQQVKPSVTTNKVVQILAIDFVNNLALVYAIL